jgi:succinate dehydrogenase flavin-adding protein (antitoxin of CptAB toxin-antitoxin module)
MITFDKLNAQNDRITELTNVLSTLLADRFLCDSSITCDLFYQYVEEVKKHLEITDRKLYSQLLTSGDSQAMTVVNRFMGGSKEIKRIFAAFLKKWCDQKHKSLKVANFEEFSEATDEMFGMVLERIQDEVEHLYPLLREVRGDSLRAA